VREFKYSRSATAPGAQGERMSMVQQLGALALLNPKNTAVVARGACLLFGLAYPVYRTFKALERRPMTGGRGEEGRTTNPLELWLGGGVEGERSGCLTYWSVYGCISMAEVGVEPIFQLFPWYYHCKLGFLVWLQSQKGAERLYRDYLRPLLLKNEKSVDAALNFLEKEVGTQVRAAETDIGKFAHYARDVKDALANFLNSRS